MELVLSRYVLLLTRERWMNAFTRWSRTTKLEVHQNV
jgi:hypothetical protein